MSKHNEVKVKIKELFKEKKYFLNGINRPAQGLICSFIAVKEYRPYLIDVANITKKLHLGDIPTYVEEWEQAKNHTAWIAVHTSEQEIYMVPYSAIKIMKVEHMNQIELKEIKQKFSRWDDWYRFHSIRERG